MVNDVLRAAGFNALAELKGLEEMTPEERVNSLVTGAQEIVEAAFLKGEDHIGLNAVMYEEWSPKILDAIEDQLRSGMEYGAPESMELTETADQEYRKFCARTISALPNIREKVANSEFKLPTFDLDNGSM